MTSEGRGIPAFAVSGAAAVAVTPGETRLLAETLTAAGVYNAQLACDAGVLTGSSLVVGPVAGALTTCTCTNTRRQANLGISKSHGEATVAAGTSTTYTVEVTNAGPDLVTGAVVVEAPVAGAPARREAW